MGRIQSKPDPICVGPQAGCNVAPDPGAPAYSYASANLGPRSGRASLSFECGGAMRTTISGYSSDPRRVEVRCYDAAKYA